MNYKIIILFVALITGAIFLKIHSLNQPRNMGPERLTECLGSNDTELVNAALHYLTELKDPIAVEKAAPLLQSEDNYTWFQSAIYLGVCDDRRSIPYLIKGLRHTAYRSQDTITQSLQNMTGEEISNDFGKWHKWYETSPQRIELDFDSKLGPLPDRKLNNKS